MSVHSNARRNQYALAASPVDSSLNKLSSPSSLLFRADAFPWRSRTIPRCWYSRWIWLAEGCPRSTCPEEAAVDERTKGPSDDDGDVEDEDTATSRTRTRRRRRSRRREHQRRIGARRATRLIPTHTLSEPCSRRPARWLSTVDSRSATWTRRQPGHSVTVFRCSIAGRNVPSAGGQRQGVNKGEARVTRVIESAGGYCCCCSIDHIEAEPEGSRTAWRERSSDRFGEWLKCIEWWCSPEGPRAGRFWQGRTSRDGGGGLRSHGGASPESRFCIFVQLVRPPSERRRAVKHRSLAILHDDRHLLHASTTFSLVTDGGNAARSGTGSREECTVGQCIRI
ncbi:uncharacterized protein LOC143177812 [Calliopsis andreniformis]|uniref:uncharacterized protein LOC143177812 n=1 Tax=Calliopsis andreniformis TaxID=337506 RepID=UPI003FCDB05D